MNAANLNQVTGLKVRVYGGGRPQLPDQIKVLLSIWYISGKEPYCRIADRFGVSESTACTITRTIFRVISESLMPKFIVWPSQVEQREIIHLYEETKRFPGVIGMIDGTHIPI